MSRKLLNQLPAFEVLASLVLTACGGSAPPTVRSLLISVCNQDFPRSKITNWLLKRFRNYPAEEKLYGIESRY